MKEEANREKLHQTFREWMRVQRLSQHRIKGEVDCIRKDGMVMVVWDTCGRWPITANDLRILPNKDEG
jgi:hypothetical protein